MHRFKTLGTVYLFLLSFVSLALADCDCGYSVSKASDGSQEVFTELLESDFTTLKSIRDDTDWVVQVWDIDAEMSHGPYGRKAESRNVVSNPSKDVKDPLLGKNGNEAGLETFVRAFDPSKDGTQVSGSEVVTKRTDMLYGSFRAAIRVTGVNGTCGAFFWYFNDTQEIDMEFLSAQMFASDSPIHMVLHSSESLSRGGDASSTPTYKIFDLPFAADDRVHEYRFDWSPGSVTFYTDGERMVEMNDTGYIPNSPGKLIFSHWSNGNNYWSGGPPTQDAKQIIRYVKAYFNSTDPGRQDLYEKRCTSTISALPNSVCQVPDQNGPPSLGSESGDKPYFFSQDTSGDKTKDQLIYGEVESGKKKADAGKIFSSQLMYPFSALCIIWSLC